MAPNIFLQHNGSTYEYDKAFIVFSSDPQKCLGKKFLSVLFFVFCSTSTHISQCWNYTTTEY